MESTELLTLILSELQSISARLGKAEYDWPDDATLSIGQAASALSVCHHTLQRWVRKGILQDIRTGGNHRRFKASEIKKLMGTPNVFAKAKKRGHTPDKLSD